MPSLEERIKERARAIGFNLVGIAPATPADSFEHLRDWLDRGFAGDMHYMERHREARRRPSSILPEVRSVVMVAMNYGVGSGQQAVGSRPQHHRGQQQTSAHDRPSLTPVPPPAPTLEEVRPPLKPNLGAGLRTQYRVRSTQYSVPSTEWADSHRRAMRRYRLSHCS